MSLFRFKDAPTVSSTPFSEFIRTASSEEKKKVYSKVLKRASEQQNEILARVNKKRVASKRGNLSVLSHTSTADTGFSIVAEAQLPLFRVVPSCSLSIARHVCLTPETPRKLLGDLSVLPQYYDGRSWHEGTRWRIGCMTRRRNKGNGPWITMRI